MSITFSTTRNAPPVSPDKLPCCLAIRIPARFYEYLHKWLDEDTFNELRVRTNNWTDRPEISAENLASLLTCYIQYGHFTRVAELMMWPEFLTLSPEHLLALRVEAARAFDVLENPMSALADKLHGVLTAVCRDKRIPIPPDTDYPSFA